MFEILNLTMQTNADADIDKRKLEYVCGYELRYVRGCIFFLNKV